MEGNGRSNKVFSYHQIPISSEKRYGWTLDFRFGIWICDLGLGLGLGFYKVHPSSQIFPLVSTPVNSCHVFHLCGLCWVSYVNSITQPASVGKLHLVASLCFPQSRHSNSVLVSSDLSNEQYRQLFIFSIKVIVKNVTQEKEKHAHANIQAQATI